ncbi:MAG: HAD family hydrolase [Clostridia bacterium]
MIKAVIFDYDGTLIDTVKQIQLVGNLSLRDFSLNEVPAEKYMKFIGGGARKLIERLVNESYKPYDELIDRVLFRYLSYYDKMQNEAMCSFDGVFEMLKKLNEQGIKVAILSNKPDRHVKAGINAALNGVEVDYIVGSDSGFPLKPDPTSLLYVIDKLGVNLDEVLYVGDGDADVIVAKNAGVKACFVLWGYRSEEELKAVGAEDFISSPNELFDYIK